MHAPKVAKKNLNKLYEKTPNKKKGKRATHAKDIRLKVK